MFERNTSKILLSGKEYPLRCGMQSLEKIQDKYGKFSEFELRIWKFIPDLDKDGNIVVDDAGTVSGHFEDPDMPVLKDTLTFFVNEGEEYEGKDPTPAEELWLAVDGMTCFELSDILHAEFIKAFERKNTSTSPAAKTRRKK